MWVVNVKNFIRTEANKLQNILLENIVGRSICAENNLNNPIQLKLQIKKNQKTFVSPLLYRFLRHFQMGNYLVFLQELRHIDVMAIGLHIFCKIIFLTYVYFARTLNPIPDRVS